MPRTQLQPPFLSEIARLGSEKAIAQEDVTIVTSTSDIVFAARKVVIAAKNGGWN